jgi:hypothetical protein
MSEITVETTQLVPQERSVTLIVDQQVQHVAMDGETAQIGDLLNAIFMQSGQPERVVTPAEDGTLVLNNQVFVVREGEVLPRTSNGKTEVLPGDKVVEDRQHHNG